MASDFVSDVVARRVREVRTKRGLTVAGLAERCERIGAPDLTAQALYRLEQRGTASRKARPVTVDELLALAVALNVAPVHLLVPPDDFRQRYAITAKTSEQANRAREWIRGRLPVPVNKADPREYFAEVPRTEYDLMREAVSIPLPPDHEEDPDGQHR